MLIELNRLFTEEEIKQTYRLPTVVHDRIVEDVPPTEIEGASYRSERDLDDAVQRAIGTAIETDGPIPPNQFRFRGTIYTGFSNLEWRLIDSLWPHMVAQIDEVMEHVYGIGHDDREVALKGTLQRTNNRLTKIECPMLVESEGGYYRLVEV